MTNEFSKPHLIYRRTFVAVVMSTFIISFFIFLYAPISYLSSHPSIFDDRQLLLLITLVILSIFAVSAPFVPTKYAFQWFYPRLKVTPKPLNLSNREIWITWSISYWTPGIIAVLLTVIGVIVFLITDNQIIMLQFAGSGFVVFLLGQILVVWVLLGHLGDRQHKTKIS